MVHKALYNSILNNLRRINNILIRHNKVADY